MGHDDRMNPNPAPALGTGGATTRAREALRHLGAAQKSRRGVSLYSRFVNRPLGRVFAAGAIGVGLGPNGVTALSALVSAAGIAVLALARPSWPAGVAVTLLLVVGFALDSADGQVARYTAAASPAGEWLDHVVDAGKSVALHGAVLVGAYRADGAVGRWLLVPLAFQVVAILLFVGGTLEPLLRAARVRDAGPAPAPHTTLRALALLPADFGVLAFSFVLWGSQPTFRVAYAALLACQIVIAGLLMPKWFRQLSA